MTRPQKFEKKFPRKFDIINSKRNVPFQILLSSLNILTLILYFWFLTNPENNRTEKIQNPKIVRTAEAKLNKVTYLALKKKDRQREHTMGPNMYLYEITFNLLMPCPFTGPKIFCAGLNFLSQPKYFTAFSASSKAFVPAQKNYFTECKSSFCLAQNVCD